MRDADNGTQRVSGDRRFRSFARSALAATIVLGTGAAIVATSILTISASGATVDRSYGVHVPRPVAPSTPNWSLVSVLSGGTRTSVDSASAHQNLPISAAVRRPITTYQETSPNIVYRGPWSRALHPSYLGRAAVWSSKRGAVASLRFTGSGISWIGPTGPTRGKADIFVNGRLVKTVDTYSSHFAPSRVLFSATYATERQRMFAIVVLGTNGHPIVAVDALLVRKGGGRAAPTPATTNPDPGPTVTPAEGLTPNGVPVPTMTPGPTGTLVPTPTPSAPAFPTPTVTPSASAQSSAMGGSVRVSSVPALLTALADDTVTDIVVAAGTYHVSTAANQATDSLWIGARYAGRTNPVTIRAETPGGVTFDGGGETTFGGISFEAGAHDQTWDGFVFAHGQPTQTGVITFGGYPGLAAPHHITLRNIRIASSVTTTSLNDHGIYFSEAVGGPHDILIDGYTVEATSLATAMTFFHSDASNQNAWNVTVRHMTVTGTNEAVQLWDDTIHDITIEDSTITNAGTAVHYQMGSSITLRRVVSSGPGLGFYSSLGTNPPAVTFIECSLS